MTDLFDDKYQPGRILIKTVGSGGPCNSWVSALAISQIGKQVDIWYSPDLTTIYDEDDDECNETYQLGSIEGELDFRKLVSWLSLNKPEGFCFDEITIEGVKGFWKDLIAISLCENYEETLELILSLNDTDLKKFLTINGPFTEDNFLITEELDRLWSLFDEKLCETGKSGYTLAQLLNHPDLKVPLCLESLEDQFKVWEEEEEEEQEAIKLKFKEAIEYAAKLHGGIDSTVGSFLDDYVKKNKHLPNKKYYFHSVAYWHGKRAVRLFESKKIINFIFPSKGEIESNRYIDFHKIFSDYRAWQPSKEAI